MSSTDDEIALNDVKLSVKRRHNVGEEDLGSQQSILKWMRHVPGPLQDVMKKRADQLDNSQVDYSRIASTNANRFTVTIATVFDQGPWMDMCQYLGMPAVEGTLYGSIKMRSLKHTVQDIVEDDEAVTMVPQLLVLIKSVHYVDEEIVAVFHDPTGEVEGYFHRELVEHIGPALVAGVGRRKSYLNITPRNIRQVFILRDPLNESTNKDLIKVFNREKEIEFQQESEHGDTEDKYASSSEQDARQLLLQRTVRDTSAELTFLSQRQVIHRNPPVRADPAVVTAANRKGAQKKSTMGSKKQGQESGLGKWQWSKLVQKPSDNDDSAMDSTCILKGQGLLDASSRLVSLITKKNARSRPSSSIANNGLSSPASMKTKKSGSVHFAPETILDPESTPCNANIADVNEHKEGVSSQAYSDSQIVNDDDSNINTNWDDEDEDEDDDW